MPRARRAVVIPAALLALAAGLACCGPSNGSNPVPKNANPSAPGSGNTNTGSAPAPSQPRTQATAQDVQASAQQGNDFAFDLFRAGGEAGKNAVASPLSVRHALALAWAGSARETELAMRQVLRISGAEGTEHAALAGIVGSMLQTDPQREHRAEVAFASRIWVESGYLMTEGYEPRITSAYGTAFEQIYFAPDPDATRRHINAWVEQQTRERIKDLLPEGSITRQTRLVLANAVYLNARWVTPFLKESTFPVAFHPESGDAVRVPTMNRTGFMSQAVTDAYKAVELDYDGSNLSMVLVMPTPGTRGAFESSLTAQSWQALVEGLARAEVRLSLPKFELNTHADLKPALTDMGLGLAFSNRADFSRLVAPESVMIAGVFHGAFIRVDEAGTEAAAATAITIAPTSAPPIEREPILIAFDHPFLFAIRDKSTGAILFLGRVTDPR